MKKINILKIVTVLILALLLVSALVACAGNDQPKKIVKPPVDDIDGPKDPNKVPLDPWFLEGWEHAEGDGSTYRGAVIDGLERSVKQMFITDSTSNYIFPEKLSVTGTLTFVMQSWKECFLEFEINLNQTDITKTTAYLRFYKEGETAPSFTVYYDDYTLFVSTMGQNFKFQTEALGALDLDSKLAGSMDTFKMQSANLGKIMSLGLKTVFRPKTDIKAFYQSKTTDDVKTEMFKVPINASETFKTLVTLFSDEDSGGLVSVLFPTNNSDPEKDAANAKTRQTLGTIAAIINEIDFSGVSFDMEATLKGGVLTSLTFPVVIKNAQGEVITDTKFGFKDLTVKQSEIAVTKPAVPLNNFVSYNNIVFDTNINLNLGSGATAKTYSANIKFKLDDKNHLNNAMAINITDANNQSVLTAHLLNNILYADISKLLPSMIDFTGYNIGYIKYDLTETIAKIVAKREADAQTPSEGTSAPVIDKTKIGLIVQAVLKAIDLNGANFGLCIDQEVIEAFTGVAVADMSTALSTWLGMDVDVFLNKALGFDLAGLLNGSSIGLYVSFADKKISAPLKLNGEEKGSLEVKLNGISTDSSALTLSSTEISKYSDLALPEWINISVNGELELSTTNTTNAEGAVANLLKKLLAEANQGNASANLTDTSIKVGVRLKVVYNSIDASKTKGMLDIYFTLGNQEESNVYVYYENNKLLIDFSEQGLPKFKYDINFNNFKEEMLPGIIRELFKTNTTPPPTPPAPVDPTPNTDNTFAAFIAGLLGRNVSDVTWVPLLIETLVNSSNDKTNGIFELTLSSSLMKDLMARLKMDFENPVDLRLEYGKLPGAETETVNRLLITTMVSDKTVIGTAAPTEKLSLDFTNFNLKFTDSNENWITSLNPDEYFDFKYIDTKTDLVRMLFDVFSPSISLKYKLGEYTTDISVKREFFSVGETDPLYNKSYNNTYMLKAVLKNVLTEDNPLTADINEYSAQHLANLWFDGEYLIFDARNSEVAAFAGLNDPNNGAYFDVNLSIKMFHYNWEGGDFAVSVPGETTPFSLKTLFNSLALSVANGNFNFVGGISTTELLNLFDRLDSGLRNATSAVGTVETDPGYETTLIAMQRFFVGFIGNIERLSALPASDINAAIENIYNRFLNLNDVNYSTVGLNLAIEHFKIGTVGLNCAVVGGGENSVIVSAENNTWISVIPFEEIEQEWNMPKYTSGDKTGQYIMDANRLSYTYDSRGNISSIVEWDISGVAPKIAYIWINPIAPDYSALSDYVKLKFVVPLEGGGTEIRYAHSYFDWNFDSVNLAVPTPDNASQPYSVTATLYGTTYTVYVRVLDVSSANVAHTYFDMTGTYGTNYRDIATNDAIRVYIGNDANNTYRTSFDKNTDGTLPLNSVFYSITATGGVGTEGADFERGGSLSGTEGVDFINFYDSVGLLKDGWSRCTIPVSVYFNNPYGETYQNNGDMMAVTFNERNYNIVISLTTSTRRHPATVTINTEIGGAAHTITRSIVAYNGRYISLEQEKTTAVYNAIKLLSASDGGKIFLYEDLIAGLIEVPIVNFVNSTTVISSVNSSADFVSISQQGEKQWINTSLFNEAIYGTYNAELSNIVNNHYPGASGKNYKVYVATLTISPGNFALPSKGAPVISSEGASYSFCVAVPASVWNV